MILPENLKTLAQKAAPENASFFKKLKKQKPNKLDLTVQKIHDDVFENTNCLACANCCKTTSPIFYQKDIERASKRLKITPAQFIDKYLHIDEEQDYVLNFAPCPFLDSDNYCTIYEDRPTACKEYPHTNRKKFIQLLDLTLKNTFICPAAFEIVEQLKKYSFK